MQTTSSAFIPGNASDELPAPQLSAPPATIPIAPEASQDSVSQSSHPMSIQQTQDAPSPPTSSVLTSSTANATRRTDDNDDVVNAPESGVDIEMLVAKGGDLQNLGETVQPSSEDDRTSLKTTRQLKETISSIEQMPTIAERSFTAYTPNAFRLNFSQIPGASLAVEEMDVDKAEKLSSKHSQDSTRDLNTAFDQESLYSVTSDGFKLHASQFNQGFTQV